MSLVRQGEGVSSGTLGVVGLRSLGGSGSPLRVSGPLSFTTPSLTCSAPSAELQPQFHPRAGSYCCGRGSSGGGGHRACTSFPGLLQPSLCDLSRLNSWVDVSRFHMETTQSVLQSLRPGDWMVSLISRMPTSRFWSIRLRNIT